MSEQKRQHTIPKTYYKAWGESVSVFDKEKETENKRNINSKIFYENFQYSIMAGSTFQTQDSLNEIYGCLDNYQIKVQTHDNGIIFLKNKEQYNDYWSDFDSWIISDEDGNVISKKNRNVIKNTIIQQRDNTIERGWSHYENQWHDICDGVFNKLKNELRGGNEKLTENEICSLIDFYIILTWREKDGKKKVKEYSDIIVSVIDESGILNADEMYEEFKKRMYCSFFEKHGMMKHEYDNYISNLGLQFIIDPNEGFYTSDRPCFDIEFNDVKVPLFIAMPGMVISFENRGEKPLTCYQVIQAGPQEIELINKEVCKSGNIIISRNGINRDILLTL